MPAAMIAELRMAPQFAARPLADPVRQRGRVSMGCPPAEVAVRCEGCGTDMVAESTEERGSDEKKWTCPRCGSWCLTDGGEVYMAAWLLDGREWPA